MVLHRNRRVAGAPTTRRAAPGRDRRALHSWRLRGAWSPSTLESSASWSRLRGGAILSAARCESHGTALVCVDCELVGAPSDRTGPVDVRRGHRVPVFPELLPASVLARLHDEHREAMSSGRGRTVWVQVHLPGHRGARVAADVTEAPRWERVESP